MIDVDIEVLHLLTWNPLKGSRLSRWDFPQEARDHFDFLILRSLGMFYAKILEVIV